MSDNMTASDIASAKALAQSLGQAAQAIEETIDALLPPCRETSRC